MMNVKICFVFFYSLLSISAMADWPREIKTKNGAVITVYQPQPEGMKGDKVDGRAAFSAQQTETSDLVFGVFWYTATMITNRDDRTVTLESIIVKDVKL